MQCKCYIRSCCTVLFMENEKKNVCRFLVRWNHHRPATEYIKETPGKQGPVSAGETEGLWHSSVFLPTITSFVWTQHSSQGMANAKFCLLELPVYFFQIFFVLCTESVEVKTKDTEATNTGGQREKQNFSTLPLTFPKNFTFVSLGGTLSLGHA